MAVTERQLRFVAAELRRLAPNASSPEGGDSHEGRRAFQDVAGLLDRAGSADPPVAATAKSTIAQGGGFVTASQVIDDFVAEHGGSRREASEYLFGD